MGHSTYSRAACATVCAAKLLSGVDRETDANVLRLSLYRPDDEDFLSHAENFLKQVVARRDVLLKEKGIPIPISNDPDDPAIHPYCFASECPIRLKSGPDIRPQSP